MNATYIVPLVGITLMVMGLCGVGVAAWRSHKVSSRLEFIRSLGTEAELFAEAAPVVERVQTPLVTRIFGPAARGFKNVLSRLYPSSEVDRVHADLLKAGLTGTVRAEEFVAVQVGSAMLGFGLGLVALVSGAVSLKMGLALPVHPSHDRRTGAQLVVASPHQDPASDGPERPARSARPHVHLGCGRTRPGAGDAGVVRPIRIAGVP